MNAELATVLRLDKTASQAQLIAAISKLQEGQSHFEESRKLAEEVKQLQHTGRVHAYQEAVSLFTHSAGEPKERAEKLALLHESAGEEIAQEMLKAWSETDHFAEQAGVTKVILDGASSPEGGDFSKAVLKYQEDNTNTSLADATKAVMKANPSLAR